MAKEHSNPAMLKVLLGAMNVSSGGNFGVQRGDGNMAAFRIDQVGVNFVGTNDQIVVQTGFSNRFQFGPGKDAAHRIVGIAQDEQTGRVSIGSSGAAS